MAFWKTVAGEYFSCSTRRLSKEKIKAVYNHWVYNRDGLRDKVLTATRNVDAVEFEAKQKIESDTFVNADKCGSSRDYSNLEDSDVISPDVCFDLKESNLDEVGNTDLEKKGIKADTTLISPKTEENEDFQMLLEGQKSSQEVSNDTPNKTSEHDSDFENIVNSQTTKHEGRQESAEQLIYKILIKEDSGLKINYNNELDVQ